VDEAYGILLGGREDDDIIDYFIRAAFPPQGHVDTVLAALREAENGLSLPMLERHLNLTRGQIDKTIKFLSVESPSPVIKQGPRWHALPVDYELDREAIEQLCALRRTEQQEMRDYMQTGKCLMQFLSRALDDPLAAPCGRCANCHDAPLWPETVDPELAKAASLFLRRSHQPIQPRKLWPPGALPNYGYGGRISTNQMAEEGRALCLLGDAGWGRMVHDGKYHDGRFCNDLIEGCIQMIDAWSPDPTPVWVTCVPSLSDPNLVPDFAHRFAARLDIPFVPMVRKVRKNRPQKEMQNSFQQANNLDGVFAVEGDMPDGPVLLIDDMVDSRWTFTVIAALLRDAGCPAVFPLALAMSSPGSG